MAETHSLFGRCYRDFSPYVPSISERGLVIFQAEFEGPLGPTTGVFTSEGDAWIASEATRIGAFCSHPDFSEGSYGCVYAQTTSGKRALVALEHGGLLRVLAPNESLVGPLGPTMNARGDVAFRAFAVDGSAKVAVAHRAGTVVTVASTTSGLQGFEGLPAISDDGSIVYRATQLDDTCVLYKYTNGASICVASTAKTFAALSSFPCINARGTLAFTGTLKNGGMGVFTVDGKEPPRKVFVSPHFSSLRGALIDNNDGLLLLATPVDGELGVYRGFGDAYKRVFGIGDAFRGDVIREFALNPVSVNGRGQLVARLKLASGKQYIVRQS
jgi:hypothetical protein